MVSSLMIVAIYRFAVSHSGIVILFLEDIVVFGGTLANLYAGISSSLVILAIIFTCKLLDNDHHKDNE